MLRTIKSAVAVLALTSSAAFAAGAYDNKVIDYDFSFEGPFGTYDQLQLQRGLKVYTQVCAGCHGMKFVPMRSLTEEGGVGFTEAEVRAYVESEIFIADETANRHLYDAEIDGLRDLEWTDNFPGNNSAGAPDLSLMAKARAGFHGPYNLGINQIFKGMGGAEYIASLMTGYTGEIKEEAGAVLYENTAFPGGWISMAPPLYGDDVEFDDGAPADLESVSKDVSAFLMWAAEPKLAARKQMGLTAVIMLALMSVLLYLTNKRIWAPVKKGQRVSTPAE